MKLSLCELVCLASCVQNKNLMKQYELSEKIILDKVSIHSIMQDSHRLDNLSKHILDAEGYNNWKESKFIPLYKEV